MVVQTLQVVAACTCSRCDSPYDRSEQTSAARAMAERPTEHPCTEPEIIPPDRRDNQFARTGSRIWISVKTLNGHRRAYVASPGPVAIFFVLLLFAVLFVVMLVVMLGAVLSRIPVVVFGPNSRSF